MKGGERDEGRERGRKGGERKGGRRKGGREEEREEKGREWEGRRRRVKKMSGLTHCILCY